MTKNFSKLAHKVREFSDENNLFDCSHIVVGLSGGPDSVALLSVLCELRDSSNSFPVIHAVHINHGIRGAEADSDAKYSEKIALELDVTFELFSYDIPLLAETEHRSLEEMGRIKRYEAFNTVAERYDNSRIAVAHHLGDVTETMLMNIFRGSGLDGLVSPRAISGDIIRPLLFVSKDELISYLNDRNIKYQTDSTNEINDVTRNNWRNIIIPEISKVSNKNPLDAAVDTYALLKDDMEFINSVVDYEYSDASRLLGDRTYLSIEKILNKKNAISSRMIRKLWNETFGNLTDFTKVHIVSIMRFLSEGLSGFGTLNLPFERVLIKINGEVTFAYQSEVLSVLSVYAENMGFFTSPSEVRLLLEPGKTTKIPNTDININVSIVENISLVEYNTLSWFFPVEVAMTEVKLWVMNDTSEFVFRRAGSSSGKKLNKLLCDYHIPSTIRSQILAVSDGENVLWVPGIGHSLGFTGNKSYQMWKNSNDKNIHHFVMVSFEHEGDR